MVKEAACFAAIDKAATNAEHLAILVLPKDAIIVMRVISCGSSSGDGVDGRLRALRPSIWH